MEVSRMSVMRMNARLLPGNEHTAHARESGHPVLWLWVPAFAGTSGASEWIGALLHPQLRISDHFAPLLHLVVDAFAEFLRRIGDRHEAERFELGLGIG